MNRISSTLLAGLILCLLLTPSGVSAQIPQLLNYQGVLSDPAHVAVPDGTYRLTFRIYDVQAGGVPLWEETNDVATINGVFEVILGEMMPISLAFDRPLWLALEMDGDVEMAPRIRFVSTPYALTSVAATTAETARALDPAATDVVHTLNGLDGRLTLAGAGLATVTEGGDVITVTVPDRLPQNPNDGDVIRWNATAGQWESVEVSVRGEEEIGGDGTSRSPLRLAQQGATNGQVLRWDDAAAAWRPDVSLSLVSPPLTGTGDPGNPLQLIPGTGPGQVFFWNGTEWRASAGGATSSGSILTWNGADPAWSNVLTADSVYTRTLVIGEDGVIGGDLTVNGTAVNLPNGSVDNVELANSSINVSYGTGVLGDASVALGGTLNLQNTGVTQAQAGSGISLDASIGTVTITNTGVTEAQAGAGISLDASTGAVTITNAGVTSASAGNGITVDQSTGDITITNTGVTQAQAGTGIGLDASTGVVTITNTGVRSLSGTANQVSVDQSTGDVTVSLPQNIDHNATPTFDGVTLDNLSGGSSSTDVVVSNGGAIETRSFASLTPGGVLPIGSSPSVTLRWDGTAWVENGNVTADGTGNFTAAGNVAVGGDQTVSGDLTVNGTAVNLPNGSIDNAELANSSINVSYGAGVSGDASVSLGGTLNLQNTGVTQAQAGSGIGLDASTGTVTITNTGVTQTQAGAGINLDASTGTVTITNTGVRSLSGTANQVSVDQSTGDVTVSLPQNIDQNATPTFDGVTLDNLSGGSSATELVVSNGGVVETRSFSSLNPGGPLPLGTVPNSTLRWDGTAWVENGNVTADAVGNVTTIGNVTVGGDQTVSGDLTVNGTAVNLPNGSIDNVELANSSINVSYGAGVSGDASVSLGGTLNLQNTGVTQAQAGSGIGLDASTGTVTITNTGVTQTQAGAGINLDASTGTVTITNTGVRSLNGTANQVTVDQSTGDVTVSLPQNIDQNASPTFDGLTLDNLVGGSASSELLVSNSGVVESRSVASLASAFQSEFWTVDGNAGTTVGTHFIGTTDDEPFQIHVDNANSNASNGRGRVMRFEPNGTSANIIGGFKSNSVGVGVLGATISGGGRSGNPISVTANYGTVSGGYGHTVGGANATIGGGITNTIVDGSNATIGGGSNNAINTGAGTSVVAGGSSNTIGAAASISTISGGSGNTVLATTSVIGGGDNNDIGLSSRWSTIVGGHNNNIADNSYESHIGAGEGNDVGTNSVRSTIGGGSFNDIGTGSGNSTISGGYGQKIDNSADRSTIGGGVSNAIRQGAGQATIAGGTSNAIDTSAWGSAIGGGSGNLIDNTSNTSTIAGGNANTVASGAARSTISGGNRNYIASGAGSSMILGGENDTIGSGSWQSTIGGGSNQIGSNSWQSTISGGGGNTIGSTSAGSTIAGGATNSITGRLSTIAGGRGLTLNSAGSFGFLGNNDNGSRPMTIATANTSVLGNTDLWLANNDNSASRIRFFEANSAAGLFPGSTNYTSFEARTQSTDINYLLPDTAGAVGDVLTVASIAGTQVTLDWGSTASINVSDSAWILNGNAGTTPGTDFIGTTDAQAFQIHVDNDNTTGTDGRGRVMRYEPNAISANIIGGYQGNVVAPGVVAATISGGGQNGGLNSISSNYSTVSGGVGNSVDVNASSSAIIAGQNNSVGASSPRSFIGAGESLSIGTNSSNSFIGAGQLNVIGSTSRNSFIGGGYRNTIADNTNWAIIGGGEGNYIAGLSGAIPGGTRNTIELGAQNATIGGGDLNSIRLSAMRGVIAGGLNNQLDTGAAYSIIAGGLANTVDGEYSMIAGGRNFTLGGNGTFGFLANELGANNMVVTADQVAVFGNTDLWLANNDNGASALRFYEANNTTGAFPGTTNYTSFQARPQSADISYLLPDTAGAAGDVLAVASIVGTQVTLDWVAASTSSINVSDSAWSLTGSVGTTAGTHYIGTNDDEPFQIHVDDGNSTGTDGRGRVMRFEPNATSANIIGGYQGNTVAVGVVSATIAGGGQNGGTNSISSNYSTISGGRSNTVGASSINSTIAGGVSNSVQGSAGNGTIAGGLGNVIVSGDHSTISGGFSNDINAGSFGSTVSGGTNNAISSHTTVVGGGNGNTVGTTSQFSMIGGGHQNSIGNNANSSTIAGGQSDTIDASAVGSTIGGGVTNAIRTGATYSAISGGRSNTVSGSYSTVLGGRGLTLGSAGSLGFLGNNSTGANDMVVSTANVAVFGNTDLWLANNDNGASQIRFYEANSTVGAFPGTANYTAFQAGTQTTDITYTLPTAAPAANGQVLTSTTGGAMSWSSGMRVDEGAGLARLGTGFGMVLDDPDTDDDGLLDATGDVTAVPFGTLRYDTSADRVQAFVSDSDGGGTDGWISLH